MTLSIDVSVLILQDMLPDYISMRLGESILFAGKAIRLLRNPSPDFQLQKNKRFQQTMRGSQRIQGFMHSDFPEKETEVETELTGEELLPQSEADKIEAMLKDLKVLARETVSFCVISVVGSKNIHC